jgi:hypothetical protein
MGDALKKIGFGEVFFDVDPAGGMGPLDQYEGRAFNEIEECDLFVILIGPRWLELLAERARAKKRDASVREIRVALQYGKRILPLLVDGASMPPADELPKDIEDMHYQNAGTPINSTASVEELARALSAPGILVERERSLSDYWRVAYICVAVLAYFLCSFPTHILGMQEYGDAWFPMARIWGGLFIWPMLFVWLVLIAIYRPLTTLVRFAWYAPDRKSKIKFLLPLIMGTALTTGVWFAEVYDLREVPWSILPSLPQPGCSTGPAATDLNPTLRSVLTELSSYDRGDYLKNGYVEGGVPWWLTGKCWPGAFFYLTVPNYTGKADEGYRRERVIVQRGFTRIIENKTRHELQIPNSWTAYAYRVSFAILAWLGLTGLMMSIFFIAIKLRDPNNFSLKEMPREDAVICLTYSIATLMTWIPFRMVTEYIKLLYTCIDLTDCKIAEDQIPLYMPDMIFGSILTLGYLLLSVGMLARYRRVVLVLAGLSVCLISFAIAYAVYNYRQAFAQLAQYWQFYVVLAAPLLAVLIFFWYLFNPANLRNEEITREMQDK